MPVFVTIGYGGEVVAACSGGDDPQSKGRNEGIISSLRSELTRELGTRLARPGRCKDQ